jgi:GT2 family glycosyltransferase
MAARNRKKSYPLTLCIVNYNGERYLHESLRSVIAQKEKFHDIILIDNASEDRSLEIIEDRYPEVRVIRLDENRGPGAARNVGLKVASTPLVLFLDNDTILTHDCPDRLVQALEQNTRAAVAMPRVVYAYNRDTIQFDGADCHFLGLMILYNVNRQITSVTTETRKMGSVVTTCFLVDRSKWGIRSPFDETFFFNLEDYDFGMRTRLRGHEIVAVPSAYCYHREGTKELSLRPGGKYSKIRVFCLIRNRWQILLKNFEVRTLVILSPILFVYDVFQLVGIIKTGWLREWLKALVWMLRNFIDLLHRRRIVQKARTTPDREILQGGTIPFTEDLTKTPLERMAKKALNRIATSYWKRVSRFI